LLAVALTLIDFLAKFSIKFVMHKIKNTYQKLKAWYRGQTDYSIGQMIGQVHNQKRGIKSQLIPPVFKPPLIARILNPLRHFWLKHWKWLLGFIATIIGLFIAYLKL
jgi:hypothetical protein